MREKISKFIKTSLSLLLVVGLVIKPAPIAADQEHTDLQISIAPGETIPDKEVPKVETPSNKDKPKDKQGSLPKTGMPADLYEFNIGIVLLLLGIILLIASQEREEEDEVL